MSDGRAGSPTVPPPAPDRLSTALRRNIRAVEERRKRQAAEASREERVAQAVTKFTGSMRFVYLHLGLYGGWIVINLGIVPGLPRFDPSFVILAMVASVEAIFLSTFVLISQNRMAAAADERADLDLQISLLAEHELTKLAEMITDITDHLGILPRDRREVEEIKKDVAPEAVLDEIQTQQNDPERRG
ncbi:DUF1003 domain-containing protein [Plastoroseomonas hellenica]|uniref:DUF1003 domain-containing protein n=1 Tax=Plastoroseomonas hellenica TaxID=2687306 RepID=UPI001BADBE2E|nr:DUF1003 domain-containing protein [Plastoroseomonas hellenica]MBR0647960.1 DUF1003 domain-containing protein [Plastoroseomonas hellenica]